MRILFISTWFPYPLSKGSKIRAYHLLKSLAKNNEVLMLSFEDETLEPEWISEINRYCSFVKVVKRNPFTQDHWRKISGWFSLIPSSVVATYSSEMSNAVYEIVEKENPDCVFTLTFVTAQYALIAKKSFHIVDVDNVMYRIMDDTMRQSTSWLEYIRRWLARQKFFFYEKSLYSKFDICLSVSPGDRQQLVDRLSLSSESIIVVPNGGDFTENNDFETIDIRPNTLIYNGSITYSANYQAIDYFLKMVFPLVRKQIPDVKLIVTGSTQGVDCGKLPNLEGVIFTGYQENIRSLVQSCWACVVPLNSGGGTRIKILEAISLGVPVISTTKGVEGLQLQPGEHILIADDPETFAAECIRLLRDPALRSELAKQAYEKARSIYDWEGIENQFCQNLEAFSSRLRQD